MLIPPQKLPHPKISHLLERMRLPNVILVVLSAICPLLFGMGCTEFQSGPNAASLLTREIDHSDVDLTAHWSQWRGGPAHGVSDNANPPILCDPISGVRWRCDIGTGNSSPIVWGNDLFFTSETTRDDSATLTVHCIDREAGAVRWQQEVGVAVTPSHRKNGHASATMAADDERVYAQFGSLGLFCFQRNGSLLWKHSFPKWQQQWGFASSPLLIDNAIIQLCDGEEESAIIALDKFSGDELWRVTRDSDGSWTTPVLMQTASGPQIIVNGTGSSDGSAGYVIAYNPADGKELWKHQASNDSPCPTAIVGDNVVVCSSGGNGPVTAFTWKDRTNPEPETLWEFPSGGPYVPTGVISHDRLFLIDDAGKLVCRDLASGELIWSKRLRGAFSASLIAAQDRIYATSEQGVIYVFRAKTDRFELLSANRLDMRIFATPAPVEDTLIVRTDENVLCFESMAKLSESNEDSKSVSLASPSDQSPK